MYDYNELTEVVKLFANQQLEDFQKDLAKEYNSTEAEILKTKIRELKPRIDNIVKELNLFNDGSHFSVCHIDCNINGINFFKDIDFPMNENGKIVGIAISMDKNKAPTYNGMSFENRKYNIITDGNNVFSTTEMDKGYFDYDSPFINNIEKTEPSLSDMYVFIENFDSIEKGIIDAIKTPIKWSDFLVKQDTSKQTSLENYLLKTFTSLEDEISAITEALKRESQNHKEEKNDKQNNGKDDNELPHTPDSTR